MTPVKKTRVSSREERREDGNHGGNLLLRAGSRQSVCSADYPRGHTDSAIPTDETNQVLIVRKVKTERGVAI